MRGRQDVLHMDRHVGGRARDVRGLDVILRHGRNRHDYRFLRHGRNRFRHGRNRLRHDCYVRDGIVVVSVQ